MWPPLRSRLLESWQNRTISPIIGQPKIEAHDLPRMARQRFPWNHVEGELHLDTAASLQFDEIPTRSVGRGGKYAYGTPLARLC